MRARFLLLSLSLGLLSAVLCSPATAALIWTPERGWQIEGGVLEGIVTLEPQEHDNALSLMNSARRAQEQDPESGTALELYKDVLSDYPDSVYAPEALYQRAVLYRARGQYSTAASQLETLLSRYPDYENFNLLISAMFATAQDVQDGKTFYLWGTIPWFSDSRVALNLYESIVKNAPYSDYAPLALMNIALLRNERGEPQDAIDALNRLTNRYPQSILSGDAYIKMAQTYAALVQGPDYDQGATRQALGYYQDYLILFPDGLDTATARAGVEQTRDTLAQSKYGLGEFYYRYRTDLQAASIFFNEAITEAPLSPTAQQARRELDLIDQGILAPAGPIDWLFGRYPAPVRETGTYAGAGTPDMFNDHFTPSFISESGDINVQRAEEAAAAKAVDKARQNQEPPGSGSKTVPAPNTTGTPVPLVPSTED